jgi:glycerol-3-phosphate cytidylyltransferase
MNKIIGYTTGVFDLFHIGHLNILKNAKAHCDELIVGVTVDDLVKYKNKTAWIPFEERLAIVSELKCVERAVAQESRNKLAAWERWKFHRMFVGSDWKNTPEWNAYEEQFKALNVEIMYFNYTSHTSSSLLRGALGNKGE